MSRICVKNLPKRANEERLRDFFSQKGEVTDAQLKRTRDGKSRQFGYVGFRSENEAAEALKFFHGSFMDTCRITCEIARKKGDPEMSRPWSRHTLKKQESTKEKRECVNASKKVTPLVKDNTEDGDFLFQVFLQVMQPRKKSKLWSNDLLEATQGKGGTKKVEVMGGKNKLKIESDKLNAISEMKEIHESGPENPNVTDDVGEPSSRLENEDDVLKTGRLFVKNLPYTATEDDLREHFSKFGNVSQVHLVVDKIQSDQRDVLIFSTRSQNVQPGH